jgi:LPXTG-motif cell wall-anchored protein
MTQIFTHIPTHTPTPTCTPTPTPSPKWAPTATPSATATPTGVANVVPYQGKNTTVDCDTNVAGGQYCAGHTAGPAVSITEAPKVLGNATELPNTSGMNITPLLVLGIILMLAGLALKYRTILRSWIENH